MTALGLVGGALLVGGSTLSGARSMFPPGPEPPSMTITRAEPTDLREAAPDGRTRVVAPGAPRARTAVPRRGSGVFVPVRRPQQDSRRRGRTVTWTVEVERWVGVDPDEFAAAAARTLTSPRGWEPELRIRFVYLTQSRASGRDVDVRLVLASPDTTDRLCRPADTKGQVSCANGHRAIINVKRWLLGARSYRGDLKGYRTYVVNHEVGHLLGYRHERCPGGGRRAPVMVQQTLTLQGCRPWPFPAGDGSRQR